MANNSESITYKITVDAELGVATVRNLKGQIVATKVPVQELRTEFGNFAKTVDSVRFDKFKKGLDTATKDTSQFIGNGKKGLTGVSNATGAATSATLELGRAISDAPYGIRGVANNLSQFASQFSFMSNKVDEATGKVVGFNGAIKNLGKAIRANAVLLAIQLIIAALDKFVGGAKKAKEETDSLSESFGLQTTKLLVLKSALDDSNISLDDKNKLVKKANEEFKDLNIELDENGNLTDTSRIAIDKHSIALVKNAKAKALASLITKEMNKQAKIEAEEAGDQLNFLETLFGAISAKVIGTSAAVSNAIEKDTEKRDELLGESEKRVNKFLKMFKENGADLAKSLLGEGTGDVFEGKFIESYYNEIAGLEDIVKDEDFDGISDTAKITGGIILPFKPTFVPPEEDFYAELDRFIERYQTVMTGLTSFVDGEFERQLTIEQNKTNILNQELNNRLLNESLSADQRKSIQNEIAQNDERLRIRQEAIKKKAFNTEKAFNISAALLETYAAASSAYKNTLANPINKLLPDAGLLRAKINAGVATAGGLLQVAAIARQKYQSSSAATPVNVGGGGVSGGASERADPSFNIVGRSGENLLINAIQAQFGKPLKAYVVSRDVTTQQQLDGMIVGQAGT